jgi:secreted trypsin-like serine protease
VQVTNATHHGGYTHKSAPTEKDMYNDIAVLRLARAVANPPIRLPAGPMSTSILAYGAPAVRIVGYGRTDFSASSTVGTKRTGIAYVTRVSPEVKTFDYNIQPGRASICIGDSGGPVLYPPNSANPWVVGVASYVLGQCSGRAGNTMVGGFVDWIRGRLAQ